MANWATPEMAAQPPEDVRDEVAFPVLTNESLADIAEFGRVEAMVCSGGAALAIRIIGSRYSSEALALRSFATRTRVPFSWIDLDDAEDVGVLLASMGVRPTDTPVVITPNALLCHPTPGELAEHLGLTFHPSPGRMFDLVVVGTGPAGLAAAVSGASEGAAHA